MEDILLALSNGDWHKDPGTISILVLTVLAFLVPMIYVYPPFPPRESDALAETHSKVGLEPSAAKPGLRAAQALPSDVLSAGPPRVQSLWIYPVKSCAGIELDHSTVLPSGLEFDRLFTFAQLKSPFPVRLDADADEKSRHGWEFITQRQFPALANVHVELWRPDRVKCERRGEKIRESYLILRFPWMEEGFRGTMAWVAAKTLRGIDARPEKEIMLPVEFPSEADIKSKDYKYESVRIWKETVTALNMSSELSDELQRYLGVSNKLALFRIDPDKLREVYRGAPSSEVAGYQPVTGFQDAFPLHLLNLSSVRDLNDKIAQDENLKTLDARRFRANIILIGMPPYEEEKWKSIQLVSDGKSAEEKAEFHVSCRTVRCKMPNVDPDNGIKHAKEPDHALRKYRNVDEGAPLNGCLGMQLTPMFEKTGSRVLELESIIKIGMEVKVKSLGSHKYIKQ
ncbi:hypothetical protein PpBr36_01730 [Pyricularia pennisetigena]|uniref:hypothetical protein n=1 Tax=Pyricularia pennisetigena TaxID=1578925 RepID=UPI00114DBEC0|nr:hypothetical protein PpBr36_01730 [Pyricularia pennisetigena]TLS29105.1 hypothetical protein PpBr36_01730 [Pyricularia pennisetigena]